MDRSCGPKAVNHPQDYHKWMGDRFMASGGSSLDWFWCVLMCVDGKDEDQPSKLGIPFFKQSQCWIPCFWGGPRIPFQILQTETRLPCSWGMDDILLKVRLDFAFDMPQPWESSLRRGRSEVCGEKQGIQCLRSLPQRGRYHSVPGVARVAGHS